MSEIPRDNYLSAMIGHYDHDKLCQHKKIQIPLNIKLGKINQRILSEIDDRIIRQAIEEIKIEMKNGYGHLDKFNTDAKIKHALMTLDKIKNRRYYFAKQNIEEGQRFNAYYEDALIPLQKIEKQFPCQFCKIRQFPTNASLHSHYRSCPNKPKIEQKQKLVHTTPVDINIRRANQERVEQRLERDEPERRERTYKRAYPASFQCFQSQIFDDES